MTIFVYFAKCANFFLLCFKKIIEHFADAHFIYSIKENSWDSFFIPYFYY